MTANLSRWGYRSPPISMKLNRRFWGGKRISMWTEHSYSSTSLRSSKMPVDNARWKALWPPRESTSWRDAAGQHKSERGHVSIQCAIWPFLNRFGGPADFLACTRPEVFETCGADDHCTRLDRGDHRIWEVAQVQSCLNFSSSDWEFLLVGAS